jgi:hypothetical protein
LQYFYTSIRMLEACTGSSPRNVAGEQWKAAVSARRGNGRPERCDDDAGQRCRARKGGYMRMRGKTDDQGLVFARMLFTIKFL